MASDIAAWIETAGQWLGSRAETEFDLVHLAEGGLPTDVIRVMTKLGLSPKEIYSVVIPERTLKHRRSRRERLSREESDRAIRLARILARAQAVFGTQEKALLWAREPKRRFDGRSPIEVSATEAGGRVVEEMLIQIDEGMFA